jgi:hypothetical protein
MPPGTFTSDTCVRSGGRKHSSIREHKTPTSVEEARAEILELSERLTRGEISLETHDAKVNDLRIFLGDTAVEQKRELNRLKDALEEGGDDELR